MILTVHPCSCGTKGCDHMACGRGLWKSVHFGSFADLRIYGRQHVCAECPSTKDKTPEGSNT